MINYNYTPEDVKSITSVNKNGVNLLFINNNLVGECDLAIDQNGTFFYINPRGLYKEIREISGIDLQSVIVHYYINSIRKYGLFDSIIKWQTDISIYDINNPRDDEEENFEINITDKDD